MVYSVVTSSISNTNAAVAATVSGSTKSQFITADTFDYTGGFIIFSTWDTVAGRLNSVAAIPAVGITSVINISK